MIDMVSEEMRVFFVAMMPFLELRGSIPLAFLKR